MTAASLAGVYVRALAVAGRLNRAEWLTMSWVLCWLVYAMLTGMPTVGPEVLTIVIMLSTVSTAASFGSVRWPYVAVRRLAAALRFAVLLLAATIATNTDAGFMLAAVHYLGAVCCAAAWNVRH